MIHLSQKQYSDLVEHWNSQRYKGHQHRQAAEECRLQKAHKYAITPLSNDRARVLICTRCLKYVTEDRE